MIENKFSILPVYHDSNAHFDVKYHIFISFRGKDVRHNFLRKFVKALRRKGFKVFTDDQIQKGEEIGAQLFQAIETSLISLVIFSPNFCDSTWCLDELVKINQCVDKNNQIVIPVFLGVHPSDVGKQTGMKFKEAFSKYKEEYGENSDRVIGWGFALERTAKRAGFCLSETK
jgi:hypothetical protein